MKGKRSGKTERIEFRSTKEVKNAIKTRALSAGYETKDGEPDVTEFLTVQGTKARMIMRKKTT